MRQRWRWLVLLGVLVSVAAVLGAVDGVAIVPDKRVVEGCAQQINLTPVELVGAVWQRHRHFLDADLSFAHGMPHYIQDAQSGTIFRWPFVRMTNGRARFAVQTRWTWFNQDWKQRSWVLLYDCAA